MTGMRSATMIGGAGAHARHASDFYETPEPATEALLRCLAQRFDFAPRVVVEPASGAGAICRVLEARGIAVRASDIRPDAVGETLDFLAMPRPDGAQAIITNPPFNLAEEFIKRALSFEIPFAFLLKATYWHAARRMELFERKRPLAVMPLTWRPAMAPQRGKSPTLDFAWSFWGRKPAEATAYLPLERPRPA